MSTQAKTMITIVALAALLVYLGISRSRLFGPWTLSREAGLALAIGAFVCWSVARIQLGKSFSVRAKATALVTRGIYSKIRNPVYVFGTMFIVGVILSTGRLLWLLALLVIVPMQVMRAKKEAQVLEAKFGDEYRTYRTKTWF